MNLVGAHSHLFRGSPAAVASQMRQHGLTCVQLAPAFPELRFDQPGDVTQSRCQQAAEPFLGAGVVIVAVSGGQNLFDSELDRRHRAVMRLHALIRNCAAFGTAWVVLDLDGSLCDPDTPSPSSEFSEVRCIVAEALRVAGDYGVRLLLKQGRMMAGAAPVVVDRLLDELASPHLGAVMDPTTYLADGSAANLDADMHRLCKRLGSDAPLVHAKSLCLEPTGLSTAGAGYRSFDYGLFFRVYREYQPNAPVIIEHVSATDIGDAYHYIQACLGGATSILSQPGMAATPRPIISCASSPRPIKNVLAGER